jgi:hypothetical protein
MTGGARITFNPLAQLTLPPFDSLPSAHLMYSSSALPASFCTAFSPSGSKFAVASQEGMVAVWDVRSRKPMKVFTTDRSRLPPGGAGGMSRSGSRPMGTASGWLYEDTWDWTMPANRAPGWGVRNVKFSSGIGGKELMTFTEVRHQAPLAYSVDRDFDFWALQHTSLLHVIDATTFEHEEIIRVPSIVGDLPPSPSPHSSAPVSPGSAPSSPAPVPAPNHHPPQPYARTQASSLQHVPAPPHLHTHPHGHGYYHHHYHSAATSPSTQHDRRLRVRVRQRDVLLTAVPSPAPVSASGPTTTTTTTTTTPLLARRRSYVEVGHSPDAGVEMDVDADTDDAADEMDAETDCLTSRAPSRAASPPPPPPPPHGRQPRRPYAPDHPGYSTAEGGGERGALAIQTPAHLDLAGTCFDPRGGWLYVASTTGIVEWRVRGSEKRWWSDSVWA